MPRLISNDAYQELQTLRENALFYDKLNSVKGLDSLEQDIDEPIRDIVAMLALLGCEPKFSCCGFNYDGQPMHKTHKYGTVYINMETNEVVMNFIPPIISSIPMNTESAGGNWGYMIHEGQSAISVDFRKGWADSDHHPWLDKGCLHFAEHASLRIRPMELTLYGLRENFKDKVTLNDKNTDYHRDYATWQYPALKSWKINKEDTLTKIEERYGITEKTTRE